MLIYWSENIVQVHVGDPPFECHPLPMNLPENLVRGSPNLMCVMFRNQPKPMYQRHLPIWLTRTGAKI